MVGRAICHFVFCSIQAQNPEVAISVFPPLEGLQRILGTWKIFVFVRPLQSQQLSVSHHHLPHLYSCMTDAIEDKKVLSRFSSRLEFGAWSLCGKRNQGWWGWWKRVDENWQFHTWLNYLVVSQWCGAWELQHSIVWMGSIQLLVGLC